MKPSIDQFVDRLEELGDEDFWRCRDFDDYSKFYESEGKWRWIWRKGVHLGKKMVVTGIVVSSAPFILPPLVVLTAIGFAFSLPAGFVFATYACTDKLMNTLLPMPSRPPCLELGTISSDEEECRVDGDEVDKGYEEDDDDDIGVEEKEFEKETRKEIEKRIQLAEEDDRDIRNDHCAMPIHQDERDTQIRETEIVEEGGYEEDVGEYVDAEERNLDSSAISDIMEGIREAEDDISMMEREGIVMPKDSLHAFVVEAEIGGGNENNVEQVIEELVFVPPRDAREENRNSENFADIAAKELGNETAGLLERIRDAGRDDCREKDGPEKGKCQESEQDVGIAIKNMPEESGDENPSVIPEEVKPSGIVGSEELNESLDEISETRNETEIAQEQAELVIERMLVVNVKTSGDHTATDIHQGTGSNEKIGTLILSEVDVVEIADESGIDYETEVQDQLADSLNKGEDFASESSFDVSIDYHEVRIESNPPISRHAETELVQESSTDSDKELVNEEKIWQQIHALRTIVGYKTAPHASCLDELEALYVFTGVELPISSKDAADLADVNEKLHSLMSIIGVK